jgi:hypothetical protein
MCRKKHHSREENALEWNNDYRIEMSGYYSFIGTIKTLLFCGWASYQTHSHLSIPHEWTASFRTKCHGHWELKFKTIITFCPTRIADRNLLSFWVTYSGLLGLKYLIFLTLHFQFPRLTFKFNGEWQMAYDLTIPSLVFVLFTIRLNIKERYLLSINYT